MFGFCGFAKTKIAVSTALFAVIPILLTANDSCAQTQSKTRPAVRRPAQATAAAPSTGTSQKGLIIVEEGTIFDNADFDAQVIGSVKAGEVYEITKAKRGAFYKIRLKPGVTGWISEAEVRPANAPATTTPDGKPVKKGAEAKPDFSPPKPKKPIHRARYRGLALENLQYQEETMGSVRKADVMLFGVRISGPNTWIAGKMNTDSEFMFGTSAPDYYQRATRNPASGYFFLSNFLFINEIPQSKTVMGFYGFGPSLRMTHFQVALTDPTTGKSKAYTLDDLTIGAVFNAGVAAAVESYAVRLDVRYYWEAQKYFSFGLGLQKEF